MFLTALDNQFNYFMPFILSTADIYLFIHV